MALNNHNFSKMSDIKVNLSNIVINCVFLELLFIKLSIISVILRIRWVIM